MNTTVIKPLLFLLALLMSIQAISQDIQFSQFYAVPMYQNPGLTGSAHRTRAILHQRIQWPGLGSKFLTSMVSVDHYSNDFKSGFGLMVLRDVQGGNTIGSWDVSLNYAYEVSLSSGIAFRPGLSVSMVSRNINYARLRFPTQFNDTDGYIHGSASPVGYGSESRTYADIGSGGILYSKNVWVGFAAHHINLPNQSFTNQVSRLPVKMSFTGGYKIVFEEKRSAAYLEAGKDISITPTFHYKFQGKSDQLDLGIYGMYDQLMVGFWYRGLPLIKEYRFDVQNNEALIFLVGWKVKSVSVSYSYDWTVSKLSRAGTGGAHEINLTYYHYKPHKKRKPMKRLPCPSFYKH